VGTASVAVAGAPLLGAAAVAAGRGFAPVVTVALADAAAVVVAACVSAASVAAGALLVTAAALEGLEVENGLTVAFRPEKGLTMAFRPENMGPGNDGGSALCMAAKGFGDLAICTMADGAPASGLLMVVTA